MQETEIQPVYWFNEGKGKPVIINSTKQEFTYDYSFNHWWVNMHETELGILKIGRSRRLELTNRYLRVYSSSGQVKKFFLPKVINIQFEHKKIILPIIIGGITGPLSIVGLSRYVLTPFTGIIMVMCGFLLLYYGLQGSSQLIIETHGSKTSFFLEENNKNKMFINSVLSAWRAVF